MATAIKSRPELERRPKVNVTVALSVPPNLRRELERDPDLQQAVTLGLLRAIFSKA